jgi:ribulose-phosphate 3-epimerase
VTPLSSRGGSEDGMHDRIQMAPSMLSSDFTRLADAVALVESAGADLIHIDVMDGHFVPNLTIGPPVIKALKRVATRPLDVHLMIDNPNTTAEWYMDAGADWVTVHVEACHHLPRMVQHIHAGGARAGMAISPATPASALEEVIADLDLVLVMSVYPGFGGQSFIPESTAKIAEVARMIAASGSQAVIEVDGGIDEKTAPEAAAAGARILVAGNAIFKRDDPAAALHAIREAGESGIERG